MITKWRLHNFKSIRNETELEFAPLTILSGANSCGKSTILQSMLLIGQTLLSNNPEEQAVINGKYTRLGQFNDIKSFDSNNEQILIGWECEPLDSDETGLTSRTMRRMSSKVRRSEIKLRKLTAEVAFDVINSDKVKELSQLHPALHHFNLKSEMTSREESKKTSTITVYCSSNKSRETMESDTADIQPGVRYSADLDSNSSDELLRSYESAKIVGCELYHFLPTTIWLQYDKIMQEAQQIIHTIFENNFRPRSRFKNYDPIYVPIEIVELLVEMFGKQGHFLQDFLSPTLLGQTEPDLDDIIRAFRKMSLPERREIIRLIQGDNAGIKGRIKEIIKAKREKEQEIVPEDLPTTIITPAQYIYQFFISNLKYLGPLRDEPRSLYPFSISDMNDLGNKGQRTAAVLDTNKDKRVRFIAPESINDSKKGYRQTTRTLKAAVASWLKYLGVAEDIETHDRGKHGHELKVFLEGTSNAQDLPHVGVGVSQVLPILVICLLSEPDTTVIIEQPELHLHPMVQTRLADFFICMAKLDVQCVVETHSEHILNRLRVRIAEDPNNTLQNLAKIYFGEKTDGQTAFRNVEINEFGAIQNWPEGFFDQNQDESERILINASLKRKKLREDNKNA